MHVVHVSPWRLPVDGYGGSSRVLWWLARAQVRRGDEVTLFAPPGSWLPGAQCIEVPEPPRSASFTRWILDRLPPHADIVHWQRLPESAPPVPWVVTVHGNSPGELASHPNKIFLSRSHAARAGATAFVYNGLDLHEFLFRRKKDSYLLFLGKVSRRSKGVRWALEVAARTGSELVVAGGHRWDLRKTGGLWASLSRRVHFIGEVAGWKKAELLAGARALLFPIQWEEPFGLVMIEALVSGTAVIATPRGAALEVLTPQVGIFCSTIDEFCAATKWIGDLSPEDCRRHVLQNFTDEHMADRYRVFYDQARTWGAVQWSGAPSGATGLLGATPRVSEGHGSHNGNEISSSLDRAEEPVRVPSAGADGTRRNGLDSAARLRQPLPGRPVRG